MISFGTGDPGPGKTNTRHAIFEMANGDSLKAAGDLSTFRVGSQNVTLDWAETLGEFRYP